MQVLIVDDDAFVRDMYAAKFTEQGHQIETAASGEEALRVLESANNPFTAVLTDMVMPGLSGVALIQAIHERVAGAVPACIVLSNQGEHTDIAAATDAGAVGYIIKAHTAPSEVVARVEEILAALPQTQSATVQATSSGAVSPPSVTATAPPVSPQTPVSPTAPPAV